jgi:TetR/AcrR family transcriptional repressor of mexJK operon
MTTKSTGRARAMRAAILAGARRLFLADGFERTSMDAVAAAIGVSKMTLYRHFKSKEALFAGVVIDMCAIIAYPELARVMAKLPLREALEAFGRRSYDTIFAPETLDLHRLIIAESRRFPDLGKLFYERGPGTNVETLAAYLVRNAKAELRGREPERVAAEFMSLLRGYEHMRALLGLEGPPSRRQRDHQVARAVGHLLGAAA